MKRTCTHKYTSVLAVLVGTFAVACSGEESTAESNQVTTAGEASSTGADEMSGTTTGGDTGADVVMPDGISIVVQVKSLAGEVIPGATVAVARGSASPGGSAVKTAKVGIALLEGLSEGDVTLVVDAPGYARNMAILKVKEDDHLRHEVRLVPMSDPVEIDPKSGGAVEIGDVRVTFPKNSLINRRTGDVVHGKAMVTVGYFNPTKYSLAYSPAPLWGRTTDNEMMPLGTMGMVEVTVRGEDGELLQVADNKQVAIEFDLPPSLADVLPTDRGWDLWTLGEQGYWIEEPNDIAVTPDMDNPATRVARFTTPHLSWFNFDLKIWDPPRCFNVHPVDVMGEPWYGDGKSITAQAELIEPEYLLSWSGPQSLNSPDDFFCMEIPLAGVAHLSFVETNGATPISEKVVLTAKPDLPESVCAESSRANQWNSGDCTDVYVQVFETATSCAELGYADGAYRLCEEAQPGLLGICRESRQYCIGGEWTECDGGVQPSMEVCETEDNPYIALDENCNGEYDENCASCDPVEGHGLCYPGPESEVGVGVCAYGYVTCDEWGNWGVCGEDLPLPEDQDEFPPPIGPGIEDCDTPNIDENCDGKSDCTGDTLTAYSLGDDDNEHTIAALEIDAVDNVVIAANVTGTGDLASFGVVPGFCDLQALNGDGSTDAFIARHTSDPMCASVAKIGGPGEQRVRGLNVSNFALSAVGDFDGSIDKDGNSCPQLDAAGTGKDIFFAQYLDGDTCLGRVRYGSEDTDETVLLATTDNDPAPKYYVVGKFAGSKLDLGGQCEGLVNSDMTPDMFVAKFDISGNCLWATGLKGISGDKFEATGIDVDEPAMLGEERSVVITGYFRGEIDLGVEEDTYNSPNDHINGYLLRISDGGVPTASKRLKSHEDEGVGSLGWKLEPYDVAAASDGAGNEVVVVGSFLGHFDGKPNNAAFAGQSDMFLASFSEDFSLLSVLVYGGAGEDRIESVTIDGDDNIVFVGSTASDSLITNVGVLPTQEGYDGFVGKYAVGSLNPVWPMPVRLFGTEKAQYGKHVAVDAGGNIVVGAEFLGEIVVENMMTSLNNADTNLDLAILRLYP